MNGIRGFGLNQVELGTSLFGLDRSNRLENLDGFGNEGGSRHFVFSFGVLCFVLS